MFKQFIIAAAFCSLGVHAHMFISSPSPIQGSAPKDPLADDGSNFPCHGVTLTGSGGQNMAVGSQQKLAFELAAGANTAVHGGGSCQLSITYETDPAKLKQASAWKVIYSIEEGCPTNSLANLDSGYQGPLGGYSGAISCDDKKANGFDCVNTFNFTIPEGVKNGQATLAWTWFNNVGNREIYMNCVAVDITGGTDNSSMADFPDIFLANLGAAYGSGKTDDYVNVKFPNPGKYVTTKIATTTYMSGGVVQTITPSTTYPLAVPTDLGNTGNAGSVPGSYGAGSYGAVTTSQTIITSSTYAPAPTAYNGGYASESIATMVPTSVSTVIGTAPAPSGTGYSSSPSGTGSSGACANGKVSCPSPGDLICIDDTHFGICDVNHCAVPRPVAPGTTCSNSSVDKRDVVRRRISRIHRHLPAHVHHRGF